MRIAARPPAESGRPRIAPLATLPVFLDLAGKRALVFGGSAAAAWKAELLASAGAGVSIFAPQEEWADEMRELLDRGASAGSLRHHDATWRQADLTGAALVVADARSQGEAGAVRAAVRAAGIPLNVIDQPGFCDFRFGAIVNRSPVAVGISTAGAAPVLGQAIRRRIEMLLPAGLARWAQLARDARETVRARLHPGIQRRAFWERFSDIALTAPASSDADRTIAALLRDAQAGVAPGAGRVTLVGAGPGDAELLTIKAVRALQGADVVLFDPSVPDAVLELARREAKRMPVDKRGGGTSCRREEISALMVGLARSGKRVVRLTTGDPTMFGRAGEDIAPLHAAGIPVEVVPGVTSAPTMPSAFSSTVRPGALQSLASGSSSRSWHGRDPTEALDDAVGAEGALDREQGVDRLGAQARRVLVLDAGRRPRGLGRGHAVALDEVTGDALHLVVAKD